MEFAVKHNNNSLSEIMRIIGYQGARFKKDGEFSIVRRIRKTGYPMFHLYGRIEDSGIIFRLHLDRARPLFRGGLGHSGEHEGRAVEEEMERIKTVLQKELGVIHN